MNLILVEMPSADSEVVTDISVLVLIVCLIGNSSAK
jgi:hypothetical protein